MGKVMEFDLFGSKRGVIWCGSSGRSDSIFVDVPSKAKIELVVGLCSVVGVSIVEVSCCDITAEMLSFSLGLGVKGLAWGLK